MTPNHLVPTLETCQRLCELGLRMETYFAWWSDEDPFVYPKSGNLLPGERILCPAPDFSELWAVLPRNLVVNRVDYEWRRTLDGHLEVNKTFTGTQFSYYDAEAEDWAIEGDEAPTPAQAAALLLVQLLESGYVTAEEFEPKTGNQMNTKEFTAVVRLEWDEFDDIEIVAPWGHQAVGSVRLFWQHYNQKWAGNTKNTFEAAGWEVSAVFDTEAEARAWVEAQLVERLGLTEKDPA